MEQESPGNRRRTVQDDHENVFGSPASAERMTLFSDAVFAIALTIMVLELSLPDATGRLSFQDLLVDAGPTLVAYIVSFFVVSVTWVTHHNRMRVIAHATTGLLWANLLVLFFVALVPFPTRLLIQSGLSVAAVVTYSVVMACTGLAMTLLWQYAYRHELVDASVTPQLFGYETANGLVMPLVFLASVGVALLLGAVAGAVFWLLDWPASVIVARILGRRTADG